MISHVYHNKLCFVSFNQIVTIAAQSYSVIILIEELSHGNWVKSLGGLGGWPGGWPDRWPVFNDDPL